MKRKTNHNSPSPLAPLPSPPVRSRATISAAIIVRDEAHNLLALLPRLRWVDEVVVVVDSDTVDSSCRLARDFGCRVAVRPFENFAAQRNIALDLARTTWVLSIDADERPTKELIREVRRILGATEPTADAFRVPIRSRIFGRRFRFCGTQDDRPVRLVRRGAGRWQGEVHETLQVEGAVGELESPLEHDTIPNLPTYFHKMWRYTQLDAERRVRLGRRPRRIDPWLAPARETFRRLVWKHGWLDGPKGWAFCGLSGFSEWVAARKHRRLWELSREGCE